jgi:DNA-binding MarR family transcriptional regulator
VTDPTRADPTKDVLIARIMEGQRRLQHLFSQDRSNPLFTSNLTMSQLKTLFVLRHRGSSGGQDLARAMGVSLATMTGIVDRLVAQALVERHEDPKDRRVRRVELSPHGREVVDGIITAGAEHQRRLMERLDVEELAVLEHASTILEQALAVEATEARACPGSADARAE